MGAFYGLWHRNGHRIKEAGFEKFAAFHQRFGPDSNQWTTLGCIAMGQAVLHTTPQSFFEGRPCSLTAAPHLFICGNVRLDYLDELYHALGIEPQEGAQLSDTQLFLHAFLKWGDKVGKHVYGDFAVLIWDQQAEELTLIRDRTGLTSGYYVILADGSVLFSSHFRAVLEELEALHIDDKVATDLLAGHFENSNATIVDGIRRVETGSLVRITADAVETIFYEDYNIQPDPTLATPQICLERFRKLFYDAIRSRARSSFPIGASLSGGLDSSSICFVLKEILEDTSLHTYSFFQEAPDKSDAAYIEEAVREGGFFSKVLPLDLEQCREDLRSSIRELGFPHFSASVGLYYQKLRAAEVDGVRVYFEGGSGDQVIPYGYDTYNLLLKEMRLRSLKRLGALSKDYDYVLYGGSGPWKVFKSFVKRKLANWGVLPLRTGKSRFLREKKSADTNDLYMQQFLAGQELHKKEVRFLITQFEKMPLLEMYSYGSPITVVSPFMDMKLIEFLVSIPDEVRRIPQKPRWLYQEALKGVLPEKIRNRVTKGTFSHTLERILTTDLSHIHPNLKKLVWGPNEKKYHWYELSMLRIVSDYYYDIDERRTAKQIAQP